MVRAGFTTRGDDMDVLPLGLWLDLVGTFVFGISGALVGVRGGLDIFGIAVLSVAAGLAGGMIRDMLLGATPPTALADPRYLLVALAAAVVLIKIFEASLEPPWDDLLIDRERGTYPLTVQNVMWVVFMLMIQLWCVFLSRG